MPTWIDELLGALFLVLSWFVRRTVIQNDKRHDLTEKGLADIRTTLAAIDGGLSRVHQRQESHESHDDERFSRGEKSFDRMEQALIVIQKDIKELLKR
jgi:hypothetical protein